MICNMKNNMMIVYISYFLEFFSMLLFRYSKRNYLLFPEEKTIDFYISNKEAYLCNIMGDLILLMFYILAIIYIYNMIKDIMNKQQNIYLKKSTLYLLNLLFFDSILYFFDFRAIIYESHALKFVIICLLTNLVVYIKYKKNNIKIE